ncbi:autotransporter outer membrane beta-barrel domain-containing protein [Hyphococcus luteus]|uniref:Autotransporter domain-containing protein n=1 Tax=Hyphococcus luteus TaxID=2058213 RepID=A0A2S7KA47_9PROT|nr:autotransporter outer membrane beta-barrel domain-containing protein [Marinicaulis flavus]PQA89353.1 hypothetical protein CW354_00295 [Marinicaulis flavus]
MKTTVDNTARRRALRRALLASSGLAALSQFMPAAHAEETVEETAQELSRRSDYRTLSDVTIDVQESTDSAGLTPNLFVIGVDADFGNDRVTLTGDSDVRGFVEKDNSFSGLGGFSAFLDFFPDVDETTVDVFGVEGGYGANTLALEDILVVDAKVTANQTDFDFPNRSEPDDDLIPLSLGSNVYSSALGFTSTRGRSRTTNSGLLTVGSTAEFSRRDFEVNLAGLDLTSALRTSKALAIGLGGDRYTDYLTNALGGEITTTAISDISIFGVTLQAVQLGGVPDASQTSAISAAMDGGRGNDILLNEGELTANATSTLSETDLSAQVKELSPPSSLLPESEESSFSLAVATGMNGGLGADRVTNEGDIDLSAFADFDQFGLVVSDGGISSDAVVTVIDHFNPEESEEYVEEGAIAEIVGLRGDDRAELGGGADRLTNAGDITGTATADSDVASVSIGVPLSEVFDVKKLGVGSSKGLTLAHQALSAFGVGLLDYSSDAAAFADGVRGGAGYDDIANTGLIDITANSRSNTVGVAVSTFDLAPDGDGPDEPFSVNATVVNSAANAVSHSVGLSGGAEDDDIVNDGVVINRADAEAGSTEVGVAMAVEDKALQIEVPVIFSQTSATAQADGIDAGDGFDNVQNNGDLTSVADAAATSTDVTVGLSLINTGGGINAAIVDKNILADAAATGIRDGLGTDMVDNAGTIDATAIADASSTSVGVDVTVNTAAGLSLTSGLAKAEQTATSRAFGVERILDDLDADASFTSTGEIDANATATSTRTSVSVDLAFTKTGLAIAAPIIYADNRAEADAGALISFEADDVFTGLADMSATADAKATSTGVGVSGAVTNVGVGVGVSVLKSSTIADSDATLLSFGTGSDTVMNGAVLFADSDATSRSTDVSVGVGGTTKGLAIGASLVDNNTDALANATTIKTGDDNDVVVNDGGALSKDGDEEEKYGEIKADALADANSTGVGVSISAVVGAPGVGVGLSAALSRAGVHGDADATAVDLGAGEDQFSNADKVDVDATGKARNETVNVALGGSMIGAAVSGAIADTSVDADANATGAEGGAGADTLLNEGVMIADATADANTVGVAASGSVAAGFAAGAAGLLADTNADAMALGMNGGEGQDTVENAGSITIDSDADAANASVAVNINVAPTGVSAGAAIVSANTIANSDAVGLSGDAAGLKDDDETTLSESENDVVRNLAGSLTVTSRADASTVSVGVNGQYTGFGGVAIIAETNSTSYAAGLFGGSGSDELLNAAYIETMADAFGSGPSVAVNPIGANIGDVNTVANAYSYGMDGGVGDDALFNTGVIFSGALADVSGELVQVTLIGGTLGDLSTKANATAYGVFGYDGDDFLSSAGDLTTTSSADVTGTSVAVNLVGASFADVTTKADAWSAALAGGAGNNMFALGGDFSSTSTANARSTDVSVTLGGAAFADSADAATSSLASSYGYLGGEDSDEGVISGVGTIVSNADARNDGAAADVAGASFVKTGPAAKAVASLFSGGAGSDMATHSGDGDANADADAIAGATSVSLIGASSAKADPVAEATARGLSGEDGADILSNTGELNTYADADMDVGRYRITLAGASIGSVSSASDADAAGLDGGADSDVLSNSGTLDSEARASLDSNGVDVTFAGANVDTASGNQTANASAAGVLGGDGADTIDNAGVVISNSRATGEASQVGVVVAGAGLVDAKSKLDATSIGLDGESGDDDIVNRGAVTSVSTVAGGNVNTSVTLLGASKGDTGADATARASIIEGGAGHDDIQNYGVGVSTATAVGVAYNVEVTAGGALLGLAESKTEAAANGLGGGAGDDEIFNAGRLDLNGTANGSVGRTSVAVAGADGGASLETDVLASAVGISGGDGDDMAVNNAEIDIDLSSTTSANSRSRVIAGASKINAGLYSTVAGVGMNGGGEDDAFVNDVDGDINIAATATISASSSSFNVAGVSATNGLMRSRGHGTGMAGGAGNDVLNNYGNIHLDINGIASSSGSNFTVAGSATSGGDVKGTTNIYGMDGGAGDDLLYNTGTIYARSDARGTFGSSAYSFAGYSGAGGAVGATARTTGVFGGAGLDELYLGGTITSIADARLTMNSDVNATLGASNGSASVLGAEAYGRGANGGANDDVITIAGALNAYGYSNISMTNTKFAGVGAADGTNAAFARSEAWGVLGEAGNDLLRNDGVLYVSSESKTTGSGAAGAAVGTTSSAAEVKARANAIGLYGGDGVDTLINTGTITGEVTNSTRSNNTVSSYAIFSSGRARSTSRNYGYGTLFYDAESSTTVINDGDAKLTYFGDRGSYRGLARADATANGVTAGVGTDAKAYTRAHSYTTLRGVRLGDGSHNVVNNGDLEIESFAFSSSAATGNGNSVINGHASADARAYANSSTLTGVESLSGALDFVNTGLLRVLNKPKGASSAAANAVGISVIDPDARSYARVELNDVRAFGVRSGSDDDRIENSGTISVRSQPEANRALARSKSGGGFSFSVDAFTDAYAYADDAAAYGVHAGDGDNTIINDGHITAVSDPYAKASAESYGSGRDGDAESYSRAYARYAKAYGVVTGAGADTIVNNGTITVSATPSATATTIASRGSYCYIDTPALVIGGVTIIPAVTVCEYGEIDQNDKASYTNGKVTVGISSGDGNDVVTNAGTINASGGTAITLGDGDDTLIVKEGSSISGSISAGAGSDTLHFVGAHSWNVSGQSFENFAKSGAGVTTLYNPGALGGTTDVFEGVLRINGGVAMSAASQLTTSVFADGSVGQFASTNVIQAGGALNVLANEGAYVDGTTYEVVAGTGTDDLTVVIPSIPPQIVTIPGVDGLQGGFDTITLPEPTALRSFTGGYGPHQYAVRVHVEPISSLMSGSSATASSFAAALDSATSFAEGGVETTIATLQSLPEEEQVVGAVESITPELSTGNIEMTSATLDAGVTATEQRLMSFRAGKSNQAAPTTFGFNFSEGAKSTKGATAWSANFNGGSAAPAFAANFAGDVAGFARGVDLETRSGALFGLSMTHLQGNGTLDGALSAAAFKSTTTTLYGAAPLGEAGYATVAMSWGKTDITGGDPLYAVGPQNYAGFDKNGSALGVSVEAGRSFRDVPGAPEMFAALNYREAKGAAYAENRLSDLSLNVEKGEETQLESEFGMRMVSKMNIRGVNIRPHLSLSWVRRYGEGESVTASFADMPDYRFRLLGERDNRNALKTEAGFNLLAGERYEVSAAGVSEFGAEKTEARGEIRALVRF